MLANDSRSVKKLTAELLGQWRFGAALSSECLSAMQSRLVAIIAVLLVAMTGLAYLLFGVYVRNSSESTLRHAASYAVKGKLDLARDELKWLLWFAPHHPPSLHLAAIIDLKQNNLPAAIGHLQRIGEDSKLHETAQGLLASALLADQQLDHAEKVLSSHLVRYPKSVIARRQLFGLLLTELRSREAIQVQEEFLLLSASDPISLSDRLLMLRDLASSEFHAPLPQDCLTTLESAFNRHRDQPHAELALGRCYLRLGNLDEAEPLLHNSLDRGPRDFEARFLTCEFWIAKGDPDRAEAVLLGDPESPSSSAINDTSVLEKDDRFWELRCRIAEGRSEYERALCEIDRAASIRPLNKDYEARRARLLQRQQRSAEAQKAYTRSHELARAELDLWNLSRELGVRDPKSAECEQVALLYESLGKSLPADLWRQLGRQIAVKTPARLGP